MEVLLTKRMKATESRLTSGSVRGFSFLNVITRSQCRILPDTGTSTSELNGLDWQLAGICGSEFGVWSSTKERAKLHCYKFTIYNLQWGEFNPKAQEKRRSIYKSLLSKMVMLR